MTWKQNIANASKSAKNGEFKGLTKSIVCENVETGEILEFVSGAEAKRVLGICRSGISSACIGKYKTNIYKGYRWNFKY